MHNLRLFGHMAICPLCSGMMNLIRGSMDLECMDCRNVFKAAGEGITDREIMYYQ